MIWTTWIVFFILSSLSFLALTEMLAPGSLLRLLQNIKELRYQNDKEVEREIAALRRKIRKNRGWNRLKAQVWLLFGIGVDRLSRWVLGEG